VGIVNCSLVSAYPSGTPSSPAHIQIRPSWLMKMSVVPVRETTPLSLRNAWLIKRACSRNAAFAASRWASALAQRLSLPGPDSQAAS